MPRRSASARTSAVRAAAIGAASRVPNSPRNSRRPRAHAAAVARSARIRARSVAVPHGVPRVGARVARRDPLPQREERHVRPLEVVDVEHDREAPRQPGLDGAVHAVGGDGVPAHGQSHEVEPRVAHRVEPAVVELQPAAVERPAEADPAP